MSDNPVVISLEEWTGEEVATLNLALLESGPEQEEGGEL